MKTKYLAMVFVMLGLFGGVLLLNSNGIFADTPSRSVSDMLSFTSDARVPLAGASIVSRHSGEIDWQIETSMKGVKKEGKSGQGAYTIWAVVFNDPSGCDHGSDTVQCGLADTLGHDGGVLNNHADTHSSGALPAGGGAAQASVFWAGGALVGKDKIGQFRGTIEVGSTPGGQTLRGPGLLNNTAHLHMIVRYHGKAVAGIVDDQIGTVGGGCGAKSDGLFPCFDSQVTIHE